MFLSILSLSSKLLFYDRRELLGVELSIIDVMRLLYTRLSLICVLRKGSFLYAFQFYYVKKYRNLA